MYKFYNWLENFTNQNNQNNFKKYIYNIFIPLFLLMEWIIYKYYWKNIVLKEILTSDEIVSFLDKQEFGYNNGILKKADLLKNNEFFDRLNSEEAKEIIKKEYVEAISTLFSENIALNIEEYINLQVTVEIKVIKNNGDNFRDRIYTVIIQFCRQYFIEQARQKTKSWLWIISIGIIFFFVIKFFLNQLI